MRNKIKIYMGLVFSTIVLCGCSGQKSAEEQIELIFNNREVWKQEDLGSELVQYAITDLDGNGRLEVIASLTQGTGMYSTNMYWELNQSLEALEPCQTTYKEDSQVELAMFSTTCFEKGKTKYYLFVDTLRDGAARTCESIYAISLEKGAISQTFLAMQEIVGDESGNITTTYTDWNNNEITEEEYAAIATTYFDDSEQQTVEFQWISSIDISDWDSEVLQEKLSDSYKGFTTK